MVSMHRFRALALTACTFAGAGWAHAQEQALTGEQIKSAWADKRLFARSTTGGLMEMTLKADGSAQVAVGNISDTGTWKPIEAGYCATWQKIRAGQERCFTVVKRGSSTLVLNPDQSVSAEILKVGD